MDASVLVGMSLLGLALGGILNLNIDRIPRGLPVLRAPVATCNSCLRRLALPIQIPVLGYIWLRGRCGNCEAAIPMRRLTVEIAMGAFFGLVIYRFGMTPLAGVILAYGSLFLMIIVIDMEWTIIPNVVVYPGILLAFAAAPIGPAAEDRSLGEAYVSVVGGGALGFGAMVFIWLVSMAINSRFGFGDLKLGMLVGLVIGFPEVSVPLYLASFLVGVVAVVLLVSKIKQRQDVIPYGPFLGGAACWVSAVLDSSGSERSG